MLLTMKAQTEAMRAVAYTASAAFDKAYHHPDDKERRKNQALVDFLIPIVKGWCTEQCVEIASIGVQIHGGMGFVRGDLARRTICATRASRRYTKARPAYRRADLAGRKKSVSKKARRRSPLSMSCGKLDAKLAASMNDDVRAAREHLKRAIDGLATATQWVVDTFPKDPNAVAAVSVPFLKLWGTVGGGWMMARAALLADAKVAKGGDANFCRAKIATARFYAEHILPQAGGLAREVTGGASSILALTEAQF